MNAILSREAMFACIELQVGRILRDGGVLADSIDVFVTQYSGPAGEGVVISCRPLNFVERVTWIVGERYDDRIYRVLRSARQVARRLAVRARAWTLQGWRIA